MYNKFTCKDDKIIDPIFKGFYHFNGGNAETSAGIFEQSKGARNQVGIGLTIRPARLHRLAELIPGLLKSLKIPSQLTNTGSFDKGPQIRFDKF